MKRIRVIVVSVFFMLCFSLLCTASAVNTCFETESIESNLQETFLSNIDLEVFYSEPEKALIECFDVNSKGLIALGSSNSTLKKICVYDSYGNFKYGYRFNSSGDFAVEWDDENINIYFMRSDVIVSFDYTGDCAGILRVKDTTENNSYRNYLDSSEECIVGDKKYEITNDIGFLNYFTSSCSILSVIDNDVKTVIYDVSEKQLIKTTLTLLLETAFFVLIILLLKKSIKRRQGTALTFGKN